jgi:5-methyltetrahydrofolate--homocysteine methyltransferase
MTSMAELLGDSRPVLSDGAIGTMLQAAGLMPGASPEIWNVEHEDRLRVIHTAYADAGAHFLTTNTFGGTRPRLALHGLEDRVHELNEAGARVAREVADAAGAVAMGSMGPTGELMEPLGLYTHDQVVDLFTEQAAGLAAGGAQLLLAETFSDLGEVRAAVEGAHRGAPNVPIAVTMTFDVKGHTMMGVSPSQALHEIAGMGVELIGGNCGSGPEEIEQVMTAMSAERPDGILLMAQSNAGLPQLVGDEFRYGGTPEVMARYAVRMQELGVDVVGSCCGSTPAHTAAMRVHVARWSELEVQHSA